MGVTYGEQNAEDIRESRVTDSLMHEKTIPTVNVKTVHNGSLETEISSSGRVLSFNSITISSEVNGKLEGEFSIKKGTSFRKGDLLFKVKTETIKFLVNTNIVIQDKKEEKQTGNFVKTRKISRNEPCTCGSGKKYKHCHGKVA